jgi:hypothetical protein
VVGRLVDLSDNGLQMEIDAPLEKGDRIRILLHVPGPRPQIEVEGTVLWKNRGEQGFAYGLDLGQLAPNVAKALHAAFAPLE